MQCFNYSEKSQHYRLLISKQKITLLLQYGAVQCAGVYVHRVIRCPNYIQVSLNVFHTQLAFQLLLCLRHIHRIKLE